MDGSAPGVGAILMLSQTATTVGGIFRSGSHDLPSDFLEVDRETQGLGDALKLLAHTVQVNTSAEFASTEVQRGIFSIVASAQRTLYDLQSFVDRYSTVDKVSTRGGTVLRKQWSSPTIANYRNISWTKDSGDMMALRGLLIMHCSTIALLTQALQR